MPDITMCDDHDCPLSWNCWRYNAPPSQYRQSYFAESPRKEDDSCDYYWAMDEPKPNQPDHEAGDDE